MSHRSAVTGMMLVGLLLAAPAHAASLVGKGIKAGLAISDIGGGIGRVVATGTRVGFTGGAFVSIGLSRALQLQPELLFAMKGATNRIELTNGSGSSIGPAKETFALDYLEIPVLARIALPTEGRIRPSLLAGPALAIRLSGRHSLNVPGVPVQDLEFITSADVGLVMGTGVELHHGPRGILLDARYTLGLTNVWGSQSALNARNRTFALMAGYGF